MLKAREKPPALFRGNVEHASQIFDIWSRPEDEGLLLLGSQFDFEGFGWSEVCQMFCEVFELFLLFAVGLGHQEQDEQEKRQGWEDLTCIHLYTCIIIYHYKMPQTKPATKFVSIPPTKQPLPTRGLAGDTDMWLSDMSHRDTALWGMETPLWVIDNKVYDLTSFMDRHPGGRSWIQMTKGQDITVLFKTHHLDEGKIRDMLGKYYVGEAKVRNQDRFDFQTTGNYGEIRRRILEKFTPVELQDTSKTEKVCYILTIGWLILLALCGYLQSYLLAILCGSLMMTFYGIGHLFIHRKPNLLRHTFLLIGFSAREQQIMHAISHHPYANTMLDYEYAGFEPLMNFPRVLGKGNLVTALLVELLFVLVGPANVLTKLLVVPLVKREMPSWGHAVFVAEIGFLWLWAGDWGVAVRLWLVMIVVYGMCFGKIVVCPHRQIQLWSQGAPEIRDYVLHMISTTTDATHSTLSPYISLIFYSGFNIHVLHHLFPTIDHSKLYECNRIFLSVCRERGMKVMVDRSKLECNFRMMQLQVGRRDFQLRDFLVE